MSTNAWDPWNFRDRASMGAEGRDIGGYKVHATDGDIGKVDEARFDARRDVSLRQRELSSIRRGLHRGAGTGPPSPREPRLNGCDVGSTADPGGRVWGKGRAERLPTVTLTGVWPRARLRLAERRDD